MSELQTLYPEIEPFDTGRLKVSPVHELYYEQCGNPEGKPVIFLHGLRRLHRSPGLAVPA